MVPVARLRRPKVEDSPLATSRHARSEGPRVLMEYAVGGGTAARPLRGPGSIEGARGGGGGAEGGDGKEDGDAGRGGGGAGGCGGGGGDGGGGGGGDRNQRRGGGDRWSRPTAQAGVNLTAVLKQGGTQRLSSQRRVV